MYLTQSDIANDRSMQARVTLAAAEQGCADAGIRPEVWSSDWRFVWASAPGWDDAWESALAGGIPEPGADPAVITDGQILSQVQSMMPFHYIGSPAPS